MTNAGAPIEAVQVAAAPAVRPAPGGGPGTLTLVDSRTGKRYEIPILEGGVGKKPMPPSLSHCQHQLPFKTKSARGAAFLATHPPTTHPGS